MQSSLDWPIACVVLAYGTVCWLAGWHGSIRASGRMYDDGYRAGYAAGVAASITVTKQASKGESL